MTDLTVSFAPGFNVITGETGAGKSVILGALHLLLGRRADRTLIRAGEDQCTVEAVLEVPGLKRRLAEWLSDNGLEPGDDGSVVLKRTFTASGANRQFINGSPTTLSALGDLAGQLIDLHGPHDHQSLFHSTRQLAILDSFGNLANRVEVVRTQLSMLREVESAKSRLVMDEKTYMQRLDLLRFQVREITEARLKPGELHELESEHRRAVHSLRLHELASATHAALSGEDDSLHFRLGQIGKWISELNQLDPALKPMLDQHMAAVDSLSDLDRQLERYLDRLDTDPHRLAEVEERLNIVQGLRRKYGQTIEDIMAFGEDAAKQLAELEAREEELSRLTQAADAARKKAAAAAKDLSEARKSLLPQLTRAVEKELAALGFKQSRFGVDVSAAELNPTGADAVEFQFAPNPGEPARPLRAIASSGEMARVMLALKTVLASQDETPVLLFDEVDANVGGETASVVGRKMHRISKNHQVLCITHLAPVAAAGDHHFLVTKESRGGRTQSNLVRLELSERLDELARMLGGGGAAARQHAQSMLEEASARK